jgi:hypothetical protein
MSETGEVCLGSVLPQQLTDDRIAEEILEPVSQNMQPTTSVGANRMLPRRSQAGSKHIKKLSRHAGSGHHCGAFLKQ